MDFHLVKQLEKQSIHAALGVHFVLHIYTNKIFSTLTNVSVLLESHHPKKQTKKKIQNFHVMFSSCIVLSFAQQK